ncbi:MAG: NapC/NirT family cytochrome c [Desulfovibrio sp.]|jgi:nitrate/TMAO reductase-like tetraheme cytochrome c subunit|nr:NapC/NirT family cytochrome c [Desulfovibrio sp.]
MLKKTSHRGLGLGIALVFCAGVYALFSATSSFSFCASFCHEMAPQAEELRFSAHALDKDKKAVGCADCHLPSGFPQYPVVKIYSGSKDLFIHLFRGDAPLNRAELQSSARRFISDVNCRSCHADLYKNAKGDKDLSDLGKISHDAYLGKNGQTRSNCAGCHINIAHLPEFDRRLSVNEKFAARIQNKEALRDAD